MYVICGSLVLRYLLGRNDKEKDGVIRTLVGSIMIILYL